MYVSTTTLLHRLHVSTIFQSSSGLFCQMSHKMLCTHWDYNPNVCIASCNSVNKIGMKMTEH